MVEQGTEFAYDVFISYSHADKEWVWDWLIPRLKDASLAVCTDRESFDVGVPALVNMENAVAASRHTLLVLTPAWVNSQWTTFESLLVQHEDPAGLLQRTLPVLHQSCDLPRRIAMLTYCNLTGEVDDDAEFAKLLDALRSVRRLPDAGLVSTRQVRSAAELVNRREGYPLSTAPGLPIELYTRCRTVLLQCREFENYRTLRAVFVTDQLFPFRIGLPSADNPSELVDRCLDYLLERQLTGGRPVLPVFLATLRDRYQLGDALRDALEALCDAVQSAMAQPEL